MSEAGSSGDRMLEIKRLKAELEQLRESNEEEIKKHKEELRKATLRGVQGQEAMAEAERLAEELEKEKSKVDQTCFHQLLRTPCGESQQC